MKNTKIAIRSKKQLNFPPAYVGIITMEIDLSIIRPEQAGWELRIIESCSKTTEEDFTDENGETKQRAVSVQLGAKLCRLKFISNEKLDQLSKSIDPETLPDDSMTGNIAEQLRQGLLMITQMECASPEPGSVPRYGAAPEDWEIVRD